MYHHVSTSSTYVERAQLLDSVCSKYAECRHVAHVHVEASTYSSVRLNADPENNRLEVRVS